MVDTEFVSVHDMSAENDQWVEMFFIDSLFTCWSLLPFLQNVIEDPVRIPIHPESVLLTARLADTPSVSNC